MGIRRSAKAAPRSLNRRPGEAMVVAAQRVGQATERVARLQLAEGR